MPNTIYFVCTRCDDKFIMDEDYVEARDASSSTGFRRAGLDYAGADCRCPICETFSGRLVKFGSPANDEP